MQIAVIAAHPDDEVLGCGGTLARLAAQGASISTLILANGLTSRVDFDRSHEQALMCTHHDRAARAGELLGVRSTKLLGFPDQMLDTVPLLEITQAIEQEFLDIRPQIVFTHHGGDLNMDHVIAFRATMTALRPMENGFCQKVLAYEVPSSTDWAFKKFSPEFRPSLFVDISSHLKAKIAAMEIYESEVRAFPHPRSAERLQASARHWGSHVGFKAAEAFECLWEIL